jgi:cytochrome c oxidase cbb3-type subunit III
MRVTHGWLCTAIAATTLACGDSERPTPPTAPSPAPPPAAEQPAPQPPAEPAATPVSETAPAAEASAGDPAKGAQQYQLYCATCHGKDGCGGGPGAAGLDPQPAKHCDGHYMNALSDEHLFTVIKEGGPAVGKSPLMAPWGGTLSDQQIWDLVAYVRTLADPPYHKP